MDWFDRSLFAGYGAAILADVSGLIDHVDHHVGFYTVVVMLFGTILNGVRKK